LIRNSYRLSYLEDAQSNPDGGWPTVTTGAAAASRGLPWRRALEINDLRNWVPTAPVLLCGGDVDPLVFWLNTELMQGYWASRAPASAPISVLDLESAASSNDPYASLKKDFAAAKDPVAAAAVAQGATDGGALAVAEETQSLGKIRKGAARRLPGIALDAAINSVIQAGRGANTESSTDCNEQILHVNP